MAANRICKVLKVNQDNERLMEEYERLASDVSTVLLIRYDALELFSSLGLIFVKVTFPHLIEI